MNGKILIIKRKKITCMYCFWFVSCIAFLMFEAQQCVVLFESCLSRFLCIKIYHAKLYTNLKKNEKETKISCDKNYYLIPLER